MAKSLDARAREVLALQLWQILTLQTQLDEAREEIAALKAAQALKP